MSDAPRSHDADRSLRAGATRLVRHWLARSVAAPRAGAAPRHYRAVIFKVDRIGDFVLATGAIRTALQAWGETGCLLVVSPLAESLAEIEFPRTPRLVLPAFVGHKQLRAEAARARRQLGNISCDVALGLRHQRWDFDELCLGWVRAGRAFLLEDPARASMSQGRRTYSSPGMERIPYQDQGEPEPTDDLCRELRLHRHLLAAALGREVSVAEILPVLATAVGPGGGSAVICPLGSDAARDLSIECLVAATGAARRAGIPVTLTGSAAQGERLRTLQAQLEARGLDQIQVRADFSFSEFLGALRASPLIVTTESAAAHLATAFDRPTVVVIGGGHYGHFGPWRRSDRQIWLTKPMDCFGCNWQCIHPAPYCVLEVPPAEVTLAIERLLGKGDGSR